jgi:hypothetical protein
MTVRAALVARTRSFKRLTLQLYVFGCVGEIACNKYAYKFKGVFFYVGHFCLLIGGKAAEYKICCRLAAKEFICNTHANARNIHANCCDNAFKTIITSVAPAYACTEGVKWQGKFIVNNENIGVVYFVKLFNGEYGVAAEVVICVWLYDEYFFAVHDALGDRRFEFIFFLPLEAAGAGERIGHRKARVVTRVVVMWIVVAEADD